MRDFILLFSYLSVLKLDLLSQSKDSLATSICWFAFKCSQRRYSAIAFSDESHNPTEKELLQRSQKEQDIKCLQKHIAVFKSLFMGEQATQSDSRLVKLTTRRIQQQYRWCLTTPDVLKVFQHLFPLLLD